MVTDGQPDVQLDPLVVAALREVLGTVSAQVAVVVAGGPRCRDAFSGPMGSTIRDAVALALDGFLELGARGAGSDAGTPLGPVVEGAYRLGSGGGRGGAAREAPPRTRARRWGRWWRAPTGWDAARRERVGRWRRCSPPTGWAPGSPGD